MQILILIVAAVGVAALSYFLFYLGSFFKSLIKMNEPVTCEDEEEEIEDDFEYEDDDEADSLNLEEDEGDTDTLDDYETFETDDADTTDVMAKREKLQNGCVISQIEDYYGYGGAYGLAQFLISNSTADGSNKFYASCLLQCAIAYVRFFQTENTQDMEALINLLTDVEKCGAEWFQTEMGYFSEREKSSELQEIYAYMLDGFNYSSIADSENSDKIIELAISVLLPYVSGYMVIGKGHKYNWKLTNENKNIVAKARQREWQRQMLINLNCIEETLREMQHQNTSMQPIPSKGVGVIWDAD